MYCFYETEKVQTYYYYEIGNELKPVTQIESKLPPPPPPPEITYMYNNIKNKQQQFFLPPMQDCRSRGFG